MRVNSFSTRVLRMPLAAMTLGVVVLGAGQAASQQPAFVYVAKFVCGRAATVGAVPPPVATGFYFTAVNVHTLIENKFEKIFSIALPGEKVGRVSRPVTETMKPNEAMEIDCPDISKQLDVGQGSFVKGFVTIQAERDLDIVAVYTAAATATGNVVALEVERVPKR
jgi:hypothetical protein